MQGLKKSGFVLLVIPWLIFMLNDFVNGNGALQYNQGEDRRNKGGLPIHFYGKMKGSVFLTNPKSRFVSLGLDVVLRRLRLACHT